MGFMLALLSFILFYTTSIRDPKKACQARLLFILSFFFFTLEAIYFWRFVIFLYLRIVFPIPSSSIKNRIEAHKIAFYPIFSLYMLRPLYLDEMRQDEGGSIPFTWGVSESSIVLAVTRIEHALNAGWKTPTILVLTSRHSSWLNSSLAW